MLHRLQVFLSELKETVFETTRYLFSKPRINIPDRFKNWLAGKFKIWIWDIDLRRNIVLFVAAALLVRFILTYERINQTLQVISAIPSLLEFYGILYIFFFCILIIILFLLACLISKIKGGQFFLISILGLLLAKYSINIHKSIIENLSNILEPASIILNCNTFLSFSNFFQLVAAILVGIFLYLFFRLLSRSSGIDIAPFEDAVSDPEDRLSNGKAISDLLAAELHRIYHLHNFIEDGKLQLIQTSSPLLRFCRENLNLCLFKGENLEKSLSQAGSIPISNGIMLQIGGILLAIRQLWPSCSSQVITGSLSLHSYDLKLQLLARYEETNHSSEIHAYKVKQEEVSPGKSNNLVASMVQILAYQIALDLSSTSLLTSNWQAFQLLTEALSHFYRHERTNSLKELENAFTCCQDAIDKDKHYKKIADLLCLISFSYLNKDRCEEAKKALIKALEMNPNNPYVHLFYGNMHYLLNEYDEAFKHYKFAKELDPKQSAIYLRTGCVHLVAPHSSPLHDYNQARKDFWYALNLESGNSATQSLIAWLDFLCHLQEQEKGHYEKAEISLDRALNRLEQIPQAKKTYIDYSNLAIFLLYKGDVKKARFNWWKALQLCSGDTPDKIKPIYDRLHYRYYKLLTTRSIDEIKQCAIELKDFSEKNKHFAYKRVIEDLLLDAKIIFKKCIGLGEFFQRSEISVFEIHSAKLNLAVINKLDLIEDSSLPEDYRLIGIAMQYFIEILHAYSIQ